MFNTYGKVRQNGVCYPTSLSKIHLGMRVHRYMEEDSISIYSVPLECRGMGLDFSLLPWEYKFSPGNSNSPNDSTLKKKAISLMIELSNFGF